MLLVGLVLFHHFYFSTIIKNIGITNEAEAVIKKLLQSATEVYYKMYHVLESITNCNNEMLQVLQSVINRHYKVRQILYNVTVIT